MTTTKHPSRDSVIQSLASGLKILGVLVFVILASLVAGLFLFGSVPVIGVFISLGIVLVGIAVLYGFAKRSIA